MASILIPLCLSLFMPDDRLIYGCPIDDYEIQIFNPQGRLERKIYRAFDPQAISGPGKTSHSQSEKKASGKSASNRFPKQHAPYLSVNNDDAGHTSSRSFPNI